MSDSWKITLPITRAEAEAIDALDEPVFGAVLMTSETVEDDREHWRLDVYLEREPAPDTLTAIRALAPSACADPQVKRLGEEDWVTMSQAGLEPIRTRWFTVHTAAHPAPAPDGGRTFLIEAGQAFGTGHHQTTAGCLEMLEALAREGRRFAKVIDIGTGTGLLAFAAMYLWTGAEFIATDIDPVAIEVTRENAAANDIDIGQDLDELALIVADGARDPAIEDQAPYDLLIANILAGPLVSMAPEIAGIAAPGATIVLAGLLETQRADVVAAFEACGCILDAVDRRDDWSILRLAAGGTRYVPSGPIDPKGRDGWALDI